MRVKDYTVWDANIKRNYRINRKKTFLRGLSFRIMTVDEFARIVAVEYDAHISVKYTFKQVIVNISYQNVLNFSA